MPALNAFLICAARGLGFDLRQGRALVDGIRRAGEVAL
jgi:hypothetical protein